MRLGAQRRYLIFIYDPKITLPQVNPMVIQYL